MEKTQRTILLAEDNENDIELTLSTLQSIQLSGPVDVVRDGAQVMDYLFCRGDYKKRKPGHPAVILLDIKMPRIDGLQVLQMIKSDPNLKSIPVVMLTSSCQERDLVKSYAMGVNAYVVKPVEFNQFTDAIKQLGVFWSLLNEPAPAMVGTSDTKN